MALNENDIKLMSELEGKVDAILNDIKELYTKELKQYAESIILDAHQKLKAIAKENGVTLPN